MDKETECTRSKFVDDALLGGVADTPNSCTAIQRDLTRLKKWTERNLLKFNKRGCKVMNLESSTSVQWYRLESKKLKTSQQCVPVALEAQCPHGMH